MFHYFLIKYKQIGQNIGKFIYLLNKQSERGGGGIIIYGFAEFLVCTLQIHDHAAFSKRMGCVLSLTKHCTKSTFYPRNK